MGRHLAVAGAIALVAFAALVIVTSRSSFQRERQHAASQLTAAAQTTADGFAEDSVEPLLDSLVDDAGLAGDPVACSASLAPLVTTTDMAHLHVLRADRSEVCSLRHPSISTAALPLGDWFDQVLASGSYVITEPTIDELSGQPAAVSAVPLAGGDRVLVAVVYTGVPELPVPSGLPRELWLVMLDPDRTLVAARTANAPYELGQPVPGTPLARTVPPAGATRDDAGGEALLLREAYATEHEWPVIAGVPSDVALRPARSLQRRSALLAGLLALVLSGVGVVLHRRLVRPVRKLHATIEASRLGGSGVRAPIEGPAELAQVASAYNTLMAERTTLEDDLRHQATHDVLTGLPNRLALTTALTAALDGDGSASVALLFIDLDRFKLVNDSHGHAVGDRLLVALGRRLVRAFGTCMVARFGGDEFLVLATGMPDEEGTRALAAEVARVLRQPFRIDDLHLWLSGSVGIAMPAPGDGAEDVIRNADTAMYRAKAAGPDQVAVFDGAMRAWSLGLLNTERDLHTALELDQFELHYQPVISLDTGRTVRVEALLRWRHPERGLLLPGDFIGVAEQTRLIVPIGRWVLEEACRQNVAWRKAYGQHLPVAVNVAAHQLARADLAETVGAALRGTGANPSDLTIEVTESAVLDDAELACATLEALRLRGVRVAVDDFGTGYSSLSYLQRLPVDEVKIDRSFLELFGRDERTEAIVSSLIGLSHAMRLEVVAEGVETAAQRDALAAMGCDLAQGFHIAPPITPDEVVRFLERRGEVAKAPSAPRL